MDCNYFSLEILYYFQYILKRTIRERDLKKEKERMRKDDKSIEIVLDRARINMYRNCEIYNKFKDIKSMKVRLVKYQLSTGETEYLLIDISSKELNTNGIGELYFERKGIESTYNILKNKFQIENFTGKLPQLIEQNLYATLYLCNIV